ncbi:MAG: amidohydrolase family protein, partial [Haliea sp.]|uniref:amidohydrolase family protein n=1 Tax=Haliea sp. TaxID=1932666 RepID=UPI0032EDEABB
KRIALSGTPVTTTLLAHHNLYRVANEGEPVLSRPGTEWLNPFVQTIEAEGFTQWLHTPPEPVGRDDAFYASVAKIFDEEGVLLVGGSDAGIFTNIPGRSLIDELELLVAAGLSPYRALQTATFNSSRVLDEPDRGCLTEGCVADVALYACDPLADIRCLQRPSSVILEGRHFDRAALDALLESAATTNVSRTETNLFSGLGAQGTSLEGLVPGT